MLAFKYVYNVRHMPSLIFKCVFNCAAAFIFFLCVRLRMYDLTIDVKFIPVSCIFSVSWVQSKMITSLFFVF